MIVANLVDLDNLDDAAIERIEAVLAVRREAARKARRREICLAAAKVAGENRRARKAAGIKLERKPANMTKGQFQQRARKAAETRAKRHPAGSKPPKPKTPCEVCDNPAICRGLCMRHQQQWRRSGLELDAWKAAHGSEKEGAESPAPTTSTPDRSRRSGPRYAV